MLVPTELEAQPTICRFAMFRSRKRMEYLMSEFLMHRSLEIHLLHFVAFFHVASLFSTGVDNKRGGVDNEKALELTNSTVFHRGRQ